MDEKYLEKTSFQLNYLFIQTEKGKCHVVVKQSSLENLKSEANSISEYLTHTPILGHHISFYASTALFTQVVYCYIYINPKIQI